MTKYDIILIKKLLYYYIYMIYIYRTYIELIKY